MSALPTAPAARAYAKPAVQRFGTFRQITRQGFDGVADGGLILAADGSVGAAADPVASGSR